MHYFWFVPLFVLLAVGVWVLYLVVGRGLPKVSNRSVEDALAEDDDPAAKPAAKSESAS